MAGVSKQKRGRTSKSKPAPIKSTGNIRQRRKKESFGRDVVTAMYRRSPSSPRHGHPDWTDDLANRMDIYIEEGASVLVRSDGVGAQLPTHLYPPYLFETSQADTAVEGWVELLMSAVRNFSYSNFEPKSPQKQRRKLNQLDKENEISRAEGAVDAREALEWLEAIWTLVHNKHRIPGNTLVKALASSFYVGRLVERMEIRAFEGFVKIGRKSHQGGVNSAAATNEAHIERHSQYQAAVDEFQKYGNPGGDSYEQATKKVARLFDVAHKTVKNNSINKWKKSGGRPKKT